MQKSTQKWLMFYGGMLVIALAALAALFQLPDRSLLVAFLDVGQGDAIYIRTPGGNEMLIDGGPDNAVIEELGRVRNFFDTRIELIVLTHPNLDHLAGLLPVIERYEIGAALITGVAYPSNIYRRFLDTLAKKGIPLIYADAAHDIDFGDGTFFDVIYPFASMIGRPITEINNSSIMGIFRGEKKILLTGDAEQEVEQRLAESTTNLQADILKIGHHGSKTSTTEAFLKKVSPQIAVISAGRRNRYEHPHSEILRRLEEKGILIRRTDREGTILFR